MRLRSKNNVKVNFEMKKKKFKQTRLIFKIVKDPFKHWISTNTKISSFRNTDISNNCTNSQLTPNKYDADSDVYILTSNKNNKSKTRLATRSMCKTEMTNINCNLFSKKSSRPKRLIIPKRNEPLLGISWKEESQLNKALYASLQEIKPFKAYPMGNPENEDRQSSNSNSLDSDYNSVTPMNIKTNSFGRNLSSTNNTPDTLLNYIARVKIKAQRKFAEGFQAGVASTELLPKPVNITIPPHVKFPDDIPSTEDFIRFLILRGTDSMPSELDFFNYPHQFCPANNTNKLNSINNKPNDINSVKMPIQSNHCITEQNKLSKNHEKSFQNQSPLKSELMQKTRFCKPKTGLKKYPNCAISLHQLNCNRSRCSLLSTPRSSQKFLLRSNRQLSAGWTNSLAERSGTQLLPLLSKQLDCRLANQRTGRYNTRSLMAAKNRLELVKAQMANK